MLITDKLNTPGEHCFSFPGRAGSLEVALTVPEQAKTGYLAILGHPHSLQGGTMNNKVVTTLVRTFKELYIPSLRFNFRGVGESSGVYDEGIGESEDMLLLARQCLQEIPDLELLFAGFSFGSYVAYRTAAQCDHLVLITIAPPVHHYDYTEFFPPPFPWIVAQGEADDVVPLDCVVDFFANSSPPTPILRFKETGHFFHGQLIALKSRLMDELQEHLIEQ